jgi:hypothetical protein
MAVTEKALSAYVSYIATRTGGRLDRQALQETFGFSDGSSELEDLLAVIREAQGKGGWSDGFDVSPSPSKRGGRLSVLSRG